MLVTFLNTCWNNDKVLIWKTMRTTQSHSSQLLHFQAIFSEWIEQVVWWSYNCCSFMIRNHRGSPMRWKWQLSVLSWQLSPSLPLAAAHHRASSVVMGPLPGALEKLIIVSISSLVILGADVSWMQAAILELRFKAKFSRPICNHNSDLQ